MSIQLNVTGMTCGHCKNAVETALKNAPGVTAASVNLQEGKAIIEGEQLDLNALIAAVQEEGYTASLAR
jgi:copper chaperone CopZ